jgi:hypothetical protein
MISSSCAVKDSNVPDLRSTDFRYPAAPEGSFSMFRPLFRDASTGGGGFGGNLPSESAHGPSR